MSFSIHNLLHHDLGMTYDTSLVLSLSSPVYSPYSLRDRVCRATRRGHERRLLRACLQVHERGVGCQMHEYFK